MKIKVKKFYSRICKNVKFTNVIKSLKRCYMSEFILEQLKMWVSDWIINDFKKIARLLNPQCI